MFYSIEPRVTLSTTVTVKTTTELSNTMTTTTNAMKNDSFGGESTALPEIYYYGDFGMMVTYKYHNFNFYNYTNYF